MLFVSVFTLSVYNDQFINIPIFSGNDKFKTNMLEFKQIEKNIYRITLFIPVS
jgi:hypothetical protein